MENWLIYTLIAVGLIIVSLFFEEAREFYIEQLEALWEGLLYFFSFQWVAEIPEFFSGLFENLSEFSYVGIAFAVLGTGLIYVFRGNLIEPFMAGFGPTGQIIWTIVTYLGVFIGCYLLGNKFENM